MLRAVFGVGATGTDTLLSTGRHVPEGSSVRESWVVTPAVMIGAAVFASGYLAKINWEAIFWVHILAVLSLIVVLICLPMDKPMRNAAADTLQPKR